MRLYYDSGGQAANSISTVDNSPISSNPAAATKVCLSTRTGASGLISHEVAEFAWSLVAVGGAIHPLPDAG